MEERYTQKKQYFMNEEVTIIQTYKEGYTESQNMWIPVQDFFKVQGRLRSDGQVEGTDKTKLITFIKEDLGEETAVESFNIRQKDITGRDNPQDMGCIRLDVLALAVTQFKPTARKGVGALLIWRTYMQWLNGLLNQAHAHELLVRDEKIKDLEEYKKIADLYTIKGNTLNDIASATGVQRKLIEKWCLENKWYSKHNNDVYIKEKTLAVRTRKNAIAFTDKGKQILLTKFNDPNKRIL